MPDSGTSIPAAPAAAQPSPLQRALLALANRQSLSEQEASDVFSVVMRGEATPAQLGGLLLALRVKGETPAEVAGAARAPRAALIPGPAVGPHPVDTCRTGGGAVTTLNIPPAARLLRAGPRAAPRV